MKAQCIIFSLHDWNMNKIHIGKCENLPEWTVHFQIVPPHVQLSHNYSVHFDSSVERPFGSVFSEPNNTLIVIYSQDFAQSWSLDVSSLRKKTHFHVHFQYKHWSWRPGEIFTIFYFREKWQNILPRNIKTEDFVERIKLSTLVVR